MQKPNPQCVYTFRPGKGWSTPVDYGCSGTCPDKPQAYQNNDPTTYTVVVTDCTGAIEMEGKERGGHGAHAHCQANAIIQVDTDHTIIDVNLANGWTARVEEPYDCNNSELFMTVVVPDGLTWKILNGFGGDAVIIELMPDDLEIVIQIARNWKVILHR
jgi:hypothetical protein